MYGRGVLGGAALLLGWAATAGAGMAIRTVAGRGHGDGRPATAAALDGPSGVAVAPDGAIVVVDRFHHRVRRIDPASGIITKVAGTVSGVLRDGLPAYDAQLKEPVRATVTADGSILIAERGSHRLRKVNAAHDFRIETIAGVPNGVAGNGGDGGPASQAMLDRPADVAERDGVVWIADAGNNRIRRIDPDGTIVHVAGRSAGTAGFDGDGGPATGAALAGPSCVLPAGDALFVCDRGNHVIRRIHLATGVIDTVAGVAGQAGFDGDGALAGRRLDRPEDLALLAPGRLVVAESGNDRVRLIDLDAQTITTLAGNGTAAFAPDNPTAATSALADPLGVAVQDGTVLVAESGANRVRRIVPGGALATVAGDGAGSFGGDGGPAVDATFAQVKSAWRDDAGNLFLSDAANGRIRRVAPTGVVETVAGNGAGAFSGDGIPAVAASLANPSDALIDPAGRLLIADTDHSRIRAVDAAGIITTIAGTGVEGSAGEGGPATAAQLDHPTGLALAPDGTLVIADFRNHRIVRIDAGGTLHRIAGTGAAGFAGDGGPATAAALHHPVDCFVAADGALYIADFGNHRVRRVDPVSGVIDTVAGSGIAGAPTGRDLGDGGPATGALLRDPSDVKVDAQGNLYIADSGDRRVRRVDAAGTITTVAGSGGWGSDGDGGDPAAARLGAPLRLFVGPGDVVYVADRDEAVLRALSPDRDADGIGDDVDVCPAIADADQADGDADGVGTACDVCPALPDPGQADADGDGIGDACDDEPQRPNRSGCRSCLSGGGPRRTDCLVAFDVAGAEIRGRRAECADGAACDRDAQPGQCTFAVRTCFNVPGLPKCAPAALTRLRLSRPGIAGPQGATAAALLASFGGFTGSALVPGRQAGVTFAPDVTAHDACTAAAAVVVPAGRRVKLVTVGQSTRRGARGRDRDVVTLRCR